MLAMTSEAMVRLAHGSGENGPAPKLGATTRRLVMVKLVATPGKTDFFQFLK